ncbi:MAG: class I SAM-dependent methyltransferase [Rickettsiales bacterium]
MKLYNVDEFNKAYSSDFILNAEEEGDRVYSVNAMGPVKKYNFDPYSHYFINKARESKQVLEIGCGFGFMTSSILNGPRSPTVTANDMDVRHLAAVINNVDQEKHSNLILAPGKVPDDLDFSESKFDIIGAICVTHFLTPKKIAETFSKVYKWLKKGGEFVFVNASIYNSRCASLTNNIEEKAEKGVQWAGEVKNFWETHPEDKRNFPNYLNFAILNDYARLTKDIGFKISKLEYFSWRKDTPDKSYLGGILVK